MTAGVRGEIDLSISLVQTGAAGLGTPKLPVNIAEILSLEAGTDLVTKADILWQSKARSIALSSSENIDLAGALSDAFGATIAAAEIVAIYVKATAANTNNVVLGAAASNPWIGPMGGTGTYAVKPGEWATFVSKAGWPVTAATGDLLKVANSGAGTPVVYDILVVGRTVAA
jgi:hypothetical protein